MIKQSTSAGSPYALLAVTPGNGAHLQWGFDRDTAAGAYAFPSAWLKLKRVGSTLTASTSADGSSWTRVGSASVPMPAGVTIGLFVTSHAAGSSSTATFDHVAVTTGAGGTFRVIGGGADIWGGVDQFQYVHQPLSGDGSIVA